MNDEARKRALSLLEKRDYSRKMLIDKLTEKGATEAEAGEVADWLCELGVVDDSRYAALVARHYAAKGYGERRVREELYRRGISRELWDEAMEELPEPDETVSRLLKARLRGRSAPEDIQRAQNYLLRRGYSREEVRAAIERCKAEIEDTE
ncbi:MAG: regulatory protein RecX [Oscillospiraceae bacterium]|nr:regulatory protein RecX [Oscillospiraceae bacterium]